MNAQPWLNADGTRVRGAQLDGDLAAILSLEEETMPARRALIAMSAHLKRATLVGHPAPIVADMSEDWRAEMAEEDFTEDDRMCAAGTTASSGWCRSTGIHGIEARDG